MSEPIGRHLLLDLSGVAPDRLCDAAGIECLLREAAEVAGATAIHAYFHHFGEGQGVTGMLLLRESHISIHTWPEHGYAAVDVFMCGQAEARLAAEHIARVLSAAQAALREEMRGFP